MNVEISSLLRVQNRSDCLSLIVSSVKIVDIFAAEEATVVGWPVGSRET